MFTFAVRKHLPTPSGPPILALIDLAYQTAQRIGNLPPLNWADVSEDGIMFHLAKTVNSSAVRMLIETTSDLKATLEGAKAGAKTFTTNDGRKAQWQHGPCVGQIPQK